MEFQVSQIETSNFLLNKKPWKFSPNLENYPFKWYHGFEKSEPYHFCYFGRTNKPQKFLLDLWPLRKMIN